LYSVIPKRKFQQEGFEANIVATTVVDDDVGNEQEDSNRLVVVEDA
jgi:hypothetical protein